MRRFPISIAQIAARARPARGIRRRTLRSSMQRDFWRGDIAAARQIGNSNGLNELRVFFDHGPIETQESARHGLGGIPGFDIDGFVNQPACFFLNSSLLNWRFPILL